MTDTGSSTWRLIDTGSLPGPENMAIDEALLECFDPKRSLPLLRLYGWTPPAFSCGRFQKPEEILDADRCKADGIPVVRRITGGGIIYHTQELTYSLVCPADAIPESRNVKAAFFHLTSFLLTFYRKLGLAPAYAVDCQAGDRRLGERTPLCFAGMESCDILIGGKKIGGNAQRRLKEVIFQHGSIPLRQMAGEGMSYLLASTSGIVESTTSLADCGVDNGQRELANLLAVSFAETFAVTFRETSLTEDEKESTGRVLQNLE